MAGAKHFEQYLFTIVFIVVYEALKICRTNLEHLKNLNFGGPNFSKYNVLSIFMELRINVLSTNCQINKTSHVTFAVIFMTCC